MQEVLDSCARNIYELQGLRDSIAHLQNRDSMSSAQIRVSGSVIADCTDYSDVSSALIDKALDFLVGSLERSNSEYSGRLQEDINRAVSQLRDAKGTPCEPLKERIEAIFSEAESGQRFRSARRKSAKIHGVRRHNNGIS